MTVTEKLKIAIAALEKLASMPDNTLNMARVEDREIAKEALAKIKDK